MASEEGKGLSNLRRGARSPILDLTRLEREGHRFNFFQVVYLLEKLLDVQSPDRRPGEAIQPSLEAIYFRPDHRLTFPTRDISQIEKVTGAKGGSERPEGEIVRLTLTFLGLYGVSSPLPTYFSEIIATGAGEDESQSLRDFLDIFNHRLYSLFYRAWRKYRHYLQFQPAGTDRLIDCMLSLLGLNIGAFAEVADVPAIQLLPYAGLIRQVPRSAEGLRALLHRFFNGIPVGIQEFVPRWVQLPDQARPQLGRTRGTLEPRLGETVIIGTRMLDFKYKFRVILGPLSLEQFTSFLPDGSNAVILFRLVQLYALDHLEFDVELLLKKEEVPPLKLGGRYAQLGRISWMGKPKADCGAVLISPDLVRSPSPKNGSDEAKEDKR